MLHARAVRATVIALLVFVAALAVWLATRPVTKHESEMLPNSPPVPSASPAADHLDTASGTSTPDARAPAAAVAAIPTAPTKRPQPVQQTPDLQAKTPLEILVVDEKGQPVFDAEVALRGMRSETDRGSWYSYRGEEPTARTNAEGRARIDAWIWVNVDGKTCSVDLEVSHPDHPPFRDDSFPFGPGEHRVQLAPASRVVVHAWTGSPARAVDSIAILMETETGVPESAWKREGADWVTSRLAPGGHSLQVSSPSSSPPLFSEVQDFTLVAGESKDLPIELYPAESMEGRLSEDVPRPVLDGHVFLAVRRANFPDAGEAIIREFEGSVNGDGTFKIPNVPRGRAYLFVLARGWVSPLVKAELAAEAGTRIHPPPTPEQEAQAIAKLGSRGFVLPHTILPQQTRPFVVAMQETGVVEALVRDERGQPLLDVNVGASPNISVPGGGSFIVPWRTWIGRTDGQGLARIEDIPPNDRVWVQAWNEGWRLRERDRQSIPSVSVKAGATAHIDLVVEPNDPTKK